MLTHDYDLKISEIQQLSSANALTGMFTALGYETGTRLTQTPEALGFPESLTREVLRMERLADQEAGALQVYLLEMKHVTVALTQALARAFKNRAGLFLLVLTTQDYERLDFVLMEPVAPEAQGGSGIGAPQATLRPRILSVERRNPDPVSVRVLRRFSYTELDADYQWDKLRSAYGVAEWSEPLFNNRALFSDYYLNERLPQRAEWKEDPRPVYRAVSDLLVDVRQKYAGQPESQMRSGLLEPVFKALGWMVENGKSAKDASLKPDYWLKTQGGEKIPCLAYAWDRTLDGMDDKRDADTPAENPAQTVVSILESLDENAIGWAIVTNGKTWRLYSARAHSRATNYYEIDLEETLASPDAGDAIRYFGLLFRAKAFSGQPCFADSLLTESASYAKALGERLKENVFENVFPKFAEGFVKQWGKPAVELTADELDETFHATLTFLYRLLFLLYAEARDLLPVKETRGFWEISLSRVKKEIAEKAGNIADLAPDKLKAAYSASETGFYDRLGTLFAAIDKGEAKFNVPVYNGGLFVTEIPAKSADEPAEITTARFLVNHKIPDRFLAQGLDLLARDIDEKTQALSSIDYKSLGVRQLGSIYEGLLEFKVRVAAEKMAVVAGKKGDEIVPYKETATKNLKVKSTGKGAARAEFVIHKGEIYLENDKHERKASGSFYTPDYIVKYIVQNTVGPALDVKLEALRPKLREAQKAYHAAVERQKAFQKMGQKGDDPEKTAYTFRALVDELFDLRVLDPAMGSGHFLVEAVDFITDRLLAFLNAFPWNPVTAMLRQTRQTILEQMRAQEISIDPARLTDVNLLKRHVLKRCIYGVDLNPMAVELAKVSLWLDCFTLGAPLSFLDHHLKCGNSLIGAQVDPVRAEIEMVTTIKKSYVRQQFQMFGSMWTGAMLATDLMRQVGELPDTTAEQVHKSRDEYRKAADALAPFKRILDVYTSRWFGNTDTKLNQPAMQFLRDERNVNWLKDPQQPTAPQSEYRLIAETALKAAREKRFFHWELEFPEVFFGHSDNSAQEIVLKDNPGFDAVIGNPPYIRVQELQTSDKDVVNYFTNNLLAATSGFDIYLLFVEKASVLAKTHGKAGFILPNKFFTSNYGEPLRKLLAEKNLVRQIVNFTFGQVFADATTYTCLLFIEPGNQSGFKYMELSNPELLISPQFLSQQEFTQGKLTSAAWTFVSSNTEKFLDKAKKCSEPFSIIAARLFQGLRTSDNEVYVLNNAIWDNEKGIVIGDSGVEQGVQIESAICRPFLSGEDISRYEPIDSSKAVIIPYESNNEGWGLISEVSLHRKHPMGYAYLNRHKSRLEQRERGKMIGAGWYGYVYPKNLEILNARKILSKDIIESVAFSIDTSGQTAFATGYGITLKPDTKLSMFYVFALLNSNFLDFCLKQLNSLLRGGYVRVFTQYLEPLPIRRIAFTTPTTRRETLVAQGRSSINLGNQRGLLDFVEGRLSASPEEADVVHDLLAFLAERMIELNQRKQVETKRFLGWLEDLLKASIDDLTGKSRLKNYIGDYQKGEPEMSYAELEDILYKNKAKLSISLSDSRLTARLRDEYEASLKNLRSIKESLAWTDGVIDQVVYKLYGLEPHEIALIEGKEQPEPVQEITQPAIVQPGRPQSIARESDPGSLAKILQILGRHGALTTVQLSDYLTDLRISLGPDKAETIRREFAFLNWIVPEQSAWTLTDRGQDLAALASTSNIGEFARQLCVDNNRLNQQVVSRLLQRMWQLSPDLQGAVIVPKPAFESLPETLEELKKQLRADLPKWSASLQKQMRNFRGLENTQFITDSIIRSLEARWEKAPLSDRVHRLQTMIGEVFTQVMFGHIISPNDVEIWQNRMDWAGLTHTARDLPGLPGQVWFPVGAFRESAEGFSPVAGLQVSDGGAAPRLYHRNTPTGLEYEKQFMNALYEGYRQAQKIQNVEYVSLLAVRDWVCYRLRISHEVFEQTLQTQFPKALRREIPYSLALEVDISHSDFARLGNVRPVVIDNSPRYIISMRSRA